MAVCTVNQSMKSRDKSQLLIVLAWIFGLHLTAFTQQPASHKQQPTATQKRQLPAQPSAAEIQETRELLARLGYWLIPETSDPNANGQNANGISASLRHALIAFQKIEGRARTGVLTTEELAALRTAKPPKPLETDETHIEVNLELQVLFAVDSIHSSVRILSISSGSGQWFTEGGRTRRAITPTGHFSVQRKIKGWHKSALGLLYYPNYIHSGVAIHGNPSVPTQPVSHGCIRIPMFAAKEFSDFAIIGMPVFVYDRARL